MTRQDLENIDSGQIHLWFAFDDRCHTPTLIKKYRKLLSKAEEIRHNRFHFKQHRHQYLVTRALLKTVLSRYESKVLPKHWQFSTNKYGKPSIRNSYLTTPLQFNISHTNNIVLLGVTAGQDIGVDVEYLHHPKGILEIANKYFSTEEIKELVELPIAKQKLRFFELWTLKEAYIKGCGVGLSIPLNRFSFAFPGHGKVRVTFYPKTIDSPNNWKFWQANVENNYLVSIAIKDYKRFEHYSIKMREITPLGQIKEVEFPIVLSSS